VAELPTLYYTNYIKEHWHTRCRGLWGLQSSGMWSHIVW